THVTTPQTAMQTNRTDNNGTYSGATLGELQTTQPTRKDTTTAIAKPPSGLSATGYTVESEAASSKDIFKLTNKEGEITRKCEKAGGGTDGGCPTGSW